MARRTRFILLAVGSYVVLALAWIYLSDRLLMLLADPESVVALSRAKGVFFVIVSAAMFLLALRAVPPLRSPVVPEPVLSTLSRAALPGEGWRKAMYGFALAVTGAMVAVCFHLPPPAGERLMVGLAVMPIMLSALIGGLGPGLLATAVAAVGMDLLFDPPLHRAGAPGLEQLRLALLIVGGVSVSLLSDMLRQSLRRLEHQRHLLDSVISGTTDAVFVKDRAGRYVLVNKAAAAVVNKPQSDILGLDDRVLFDEPSAHVLMQRDADIMARGEVQTHEETLAMRDGQTLVMQVTKGPVYDASGRVAGMFGISRDITERVRHEVAMREAAVVFESSYEGIMVVGPDVRITKVNPAFTRITGYSEADVRGQPPRMLASGRHDAGFYRAMWSSLHERDFWRGEIWNRRKNGDEYPELLSISVVRDSQGKVRHYVGVFSDISQIKAHEAELDRVAHYDALTGLPNRRLLSDRLAQAIARSERSGKSTAVCFMDLDGFKAVNDEHGHGVGDRLLLGVTAHLRAVLRQDDTLARLGGDEFALILSGMASPQECSGVMDRVLETVARPVEIDGRRIPITASIGVTLFPQDNVDADTLLRHADQAMYLAKEGGRNRYHLFDPESDRQAQTHRQYLERLTVALAQREFVLHFQPKVDLVDGRVVGAEALIRWQHPERGLLPPGEFLEHLHGTALEAEVGDWVIDASLAQVEAWLAQGMRVKVSANVSADHLLLPDFHERLQATLARHPGVPPELLELEVLETAAIGDMRQAAEVLTRCGRLGVSFALDDFGTGYSSLTYLRKLPLDTLKIDQSFVRDMLTSADDLGIVEGVIRLAAVFNRQVIAEGVETLEHGAALRRLGCRLAQGYGIARSMPASAFGSWCAQWRAQEAWLALVPSGNAEGAAPDSVPMGSP